VTALQALVLGLVQGLTEFLPISSSGHLILVPALLGWPDQGLPFDAAVHLGTALALLCWFGRDLAGLAAGLVHGRAAAVRLAAVIVVGCLPAGLAGLLLEGAIQARARGPQVVALSLIVWAGVLWWADRRAARARVSEVAGVGIPRSLAIGCAQALALVPGTSRSGITITAALFAGLDRPTAARFAFLLGLPLTAAAGALKTAVLLRTGLALGDAGILGLALAASFVAGLAAVGFLLGYLQRRTLGVFVVYRIVLGLALLGIFGLRGPA
jgi:undecaprenyl-diphosphatase